LALVPGLTRDGGGAPRVTLSAGARTLRLTLRLPADAPLDAAYELAVIAADGSAVWGTGDLRAADAPPQPAIVADLPADRLAEGDYTLELAVQTPAGAGPIADYAFGVLREP
jgi:hypothetical protein